MAIGIKNLSGVVLFKSDRASIREALVEAVSQRANLQRANLQRANLQRANLQGADLQGAYLQRANLQRANLQRANLQGADLRGVDLQGADLRGVDLQGADLRGVDLQGAYLRGAYLQGADLGEQWIIQGQTRSDGYAFFLQRLKDDTEPMISAGCRYFTIAQAQAHWEKTRGGTKLFDETRAIVRAMVDVMHVRGLK